MKQQRQNLIVINGKTYDARSGMVVKNSNTPPLKKVFSDIAPAGPQKSLPSASLVQRQHENKHVTKAAAPAQRAATPRAHVAATNVHRAPQKTHTLLRSGLKRPQLDITQRKAETQTTPQPKTPVSPMTRQERAAATPKHATVSRFKTPDIAPAQSAPKQEAQAESAASLSLAQLQSQHPAMKQQAIQPQRSKTGTELKEALIKERMEEAPASRQEKYQAQQHRVNSFFSKQPRLLTAVAGALSVLLLIGYVTYLNLPGISMRVAANRAGFAATMPGYKPSGYALNSPVSSSPGQVSLNFTSNTNADKFSLIQKESNWDSQALLDNYVTKQTGNYLTYQEKGLTIYMYDGKASWVNGGVWYNINGSADLSSDQILKLATSM